jgi:hypothetical protein
MTVGSDPKRFQMMVTAPESIAIETAFPNAGSFSRREQMLMIISVMPDNSPQSSRRATNSALERIKHTSYVNK